MLRLPFIICCLLGMAIWTSVAGGKITYVDAVPNTGEATGNTTLNGALIDTTATTGNAPSDSGGVDNKWRVRAATSSIAYNGLEGWETDTSASAGESTDPLITTVTGLTVEGTYRLYGLFWDDTSAPSYWDAAFRVGSSGDYLEFDQNNATITVEDGSDFTDPSISVRTVIALDPPQPTWHLMIADLGLHTTPDGAFEIYVQGPDRDLSEADPLPGGWGFITPNAAQRTEYDGVGYELQTNGVLLPGDYDQSGTVDLDDYALWTQSFGSMPTEPGIGADGNSNGVIDAADYTVWRDNLGAINAESAAQFNAAAVPEPTTLGLGVLAMAGLLLCVSARRDLHAVRPVV